LTPDPTSPAPAAQPRPTAAPAAKAAGTGDSPNEPVELPPLSSGDGSTPGSASTLTPKPRERSGFASVPVSEPGRAEKTRDPQVGTAAADPTKLRSDVGRRSVFAAGKPYARVGDEVITYSEAMAAYRKRRQKMPGAQLDMESKVYLFKAALNDLIDRAVLLQEARRMVKDPKKFQMIMDKADMVFEEDEVPPLLRQTSSANVHELKQKLQEKGESLDELRAEFRDRFLAEGFLQQKIGPRLNVTLPEMRDYHAAHLKEFDRPAQVTWREVLAEVKANRTRAEARSRAEAALERLRRGEDFAAVARAASDGPNKKQGGLWQTSPGGYAVPAVNAALASLPVGRISPVIEGPTSFHVVRVEDRREAGPASFAEVQDKIRQTLRQQKIQRESTAYLERLRENTYIRTVFDDPGVTRTSGEQPARPKEADGR
jgi:peptidyl-prolyl cis-trans isomerase SurA